MTAISTVWHQVPAIPTEEQFVAGAKALKLPFLKQGKLVVSPVLHGPNRPGFIAQYTAMVDVAPKPDALHPVPKNGRRWVPVAPTDAQWNAAVRALRLVPRCAAELLADATARTRATMMYQAMIAAAPAE